MYVCLFTVVRAVVPPVNAVGMSGERQVAHNVQFFRDDSWIDEQGHRQLSQNIFDGLLSGIRAARELVLVDMFLFNAWQGPIPEQHRALSTQLTEALIEQKKMYPDMLILVISDPINTVYGGLRSPHFDRLKEAGIPVVLTDLAQLQDSNPLWSSFWRWLIRPLGNSSGDWLPNPFGEGRVSIRSYLTLLNFKANHRKLLVADSGHGVLNGWVSSANPHDGSSAHRNVAVQFDGLAVLDLVKGERALLAMSGATSELQALDKALIGLTATLLESLKNAEASGTETLDIQVISESVIHDTILSSIEEAAAGQTINVVMFYLSERKIIDALKAASSRGVQVRILLDVNNDAFGRQKNGVPNRPVAAELVDAGVSIRWCVTQGEQCHAKWLHVSSQQNHVFILGSANYTRRNLLDLNLETNVALRASDAHPIVDEMNGFFEQQWNNHDARTYSTSYDDYAQDSRWLTFQYRFMEFTGLSTF